MTTWKQLSPALRAFIAAPWLLIAAAAALGLAPGFRQLVLDPANKPTTDVSLASTHWTGTLDPARLPGGVVQVNGSNIFSPGAFFANEGDAYFGATDGGGADLNAEASSDGLADWIFPGTIQVGQGLGAWGAPPPGGQPAAITDATDLASVVTGFNALKADMAAYGFIRQ